jgi:adenosylcobinamide-phosphate synthase
MSVLLAFLSLLIERFIGYPEPVLKAIGHPAMWIGRLISWLDEKLNQPSLQPSRRTRNGMVALAIVIVVPAALANVVAFAFSFVPLGIILAAVVATSLLAQRSLGAHVAAVAEALETGGLAEGRAAVSHIVGRDPENLDEAGVSRAAIESLAENFSDGIVAPAFWLAVSGLPGGAAYKAVNTADSMIGHRTEKYEDFGWASARCDDLINLPASRLSALLIVSAAFFVSGASAENAWRTVWRDAKRHRSPNAGWPEAAMAGALGVALAGPRCYGGVTVHDATMGKGGRREARAADIRAALKLYRVADWLLIGLFGFLALFLLA